MLENDVLLLPEKNKVLISVTQSRKKQLALTCPQPARGIATLSGIASVSQQR